MNFMDLKLQKSRVRVMYNYDTDNDEGYGTILCISLHVY